MSQGDEPRESNSLIEDAYVLSAERLEEVRALIESDETGDRIWLAEGVHGAPAAGAIYDLLSERDTLYKALSEYEAAAMGTLARLPNHWQQYRDLLELGPGIQAARRLGREALDRRLDDV